MLTPISHAQVKVGDRYISIGEIAELVLKHEEEKEATAVSLLGVVAKEVEMNPRISRRFWSWLVR